MGIYRNSILPWLLDLAMRNRHLAAYRNATVGAARGRVLEIGVGSGLNLPIWLSHYLTWPKFSVGNSTTIKLRIFC